MQTAMKICPYSTLEDLSLGLMHGRFSARDIAALYIERIRTLNADMHAFVYLDEASVAMQAQASDLRRASGHSLGPLDGVPIALKDSFDIAGVPGSCGSQAWQARVADKTSCVVQRLRAAGMVILGKTHMVEFAFGGWGTNSSLGTPRNPWDLAHRRIPGGSSSGAAVAVAAGMTPAAIGTDTGGSVRMPAALVGITGLKTSSGLICDYGVVPLSRTLDTVGPLTRTCRDAELLLHVLAGTCKASHGVPPTDTATVDRDPIDANLRGVRLLAWKPSEYRHLVEEDIETSVSDAIRLLIAHGADVRWVSAPFDFDDLMRRNGQIISAEAWSLYGDLVENSPDLLTPAVRERIHAGKAISAAQYIQALEHRANAIREWKAWMSDADAFLTPTMAVTACLQEDVDESTNPLSVFARSANYVGAAALTVPVGFSRDGLPIGMQLMSKSFNEAALIRVGSGFQMHSTWHCRTPSY